MIVASVNQVYSLPQPCEISAETLVAKLCEQYRLPLPSFSYKDGYASTTWSGADVLQFQEAFPDAIHTHPEYFRYYLYVLGDTFNHMLPGGELPPVGENDWLALPQRSENIGHRAFISSLGKGNRVFTDRCRDLSLKSITIDWDPNLTQNAIRIVYEDAQPREDTFGLNYTYGKISITETGFVTRGNNDPLTIKITGAATSFIVYDSPPLPPQPPREESWGTDWEGC